MPTLGATRVNAVDYDDVVIELFSYWNTREPCWAVPDWEERGEGDLAGPFATEREAREILARYEDAWE